MEASGDVYEVGEVFDRSVDNVSSQNTLLKVQRNFHFNFRLNFQERLYYVVMDLVCSIVIQRHLTSDGAIWQGMKVPE